MKRVFGCFGTGCCARSSAPRTSTCPGWLLRRLGKSESSSQRSLCMSMRLEELLRLGGVDEGREVEPREGVPDRIELRIVDLAAGCHRASGCVRPKLLATSPTPTAPAFTSASSCATALSPQPGPTLRKSMPASTRNAVLVRAGVDAPEASARDDRRRVVGGHQHDAQVQLVHRRHDAGDGLAASSATAGVRGRQSPETSPSAPGASRSPAWIAAGSRRCSAPAYPAPGTSRGGLRWFRPGMIRQV